MRTLGSGAQTAVHDLEVAIIGAGPCGLACASELKRLGMDSWLVFEAEDHVGGLAASVRDGAGFTWDLGGHVVFSHFGEFDSLLARVMPDSDLLRHSRSSFIRFGDRWLPYPFQQHLRHLPREVAAECLIGLIEAQTNQRSVHEGGPSSFHDWLAAHFGEGLMRHYFVPYNEKVWTFTPQAMNATWVSDRVAACDWRTALRNAMTESDPPAWGPNNTFVFPKEGGTGAIWNRLAASLDGRVRLCDAVSNVDVNAHVLYLADGTAVRYGALVSTMPLDMLVASITEAPAECVAAARSLRHNSVYMVGIGYEAPVTDTASWRYFPEPEVPFYRATNFGKYASANVPYADTARYSSWMTEVAVPSGQRRPVADLVREVDAALRRVGLVAEDAPRVSAHVEFIPRAYPVPTLARDAATHLLQTWLADHGIRSRGRFGTWRYEIGNMDHAVKMGIDAARSIVTGVDEELVPKPAALAGGTRR